MTDGTTGIFLGITTTDTETGIAFYQANKILYKKIAETESYHNETIFVFLEDAFKSLALSPNQLSGIGVIIGPGKFTSLRIGLACVKGLAVVNNIPIKGFNTLDALLFSLPESVKAKNKLIIPAIDVRRNEIYYRIYQGLKPVTDAKLAAPEQFAQDIQENTLVFGSGINHHRDLIKTNTNKIFTVYEMIHPDPCAVAEHAAQCICQHDVSELENLVPVYVR